MRMGHHGYQPAGGGGDGVLAVTSSSLSEIKVWLTHTPTYHWAPFPAVDQTQHAYMNFKFNMNPLTSERWNAGNVLDKHDGNDMWLCIRVWGWSAIRVFFARQKRCLSVGPPGREAAHVDGRKRLYFGLPVKPMSIILRYNEKSCALFIAEDSFCCYNNFMRPECLNAALLKLQRKHSQTTYTHTHWLILHCFSLSYNTFYRGRYCLSRLLHWRYWSV